MVISWPVLFKLMDLCHSCEITQRLNNYLHSLFLTKLPIVSLNIV